MRRRLPQFRKITALRSGGLLGVIEQEPRTCRVTNISIPECACPSCHERMMRDRTRTLLEQDPRSDLGTAA